VLGFVFYKIAALFFSKWNALELEKLKVLAESESGRTAAIAKGFADIVSELKTHGAALASIQDAVAPFSTAKHRR